MYDTSPDDLNTPTTITPTTTLGPPPVVIRKFTPRTTTTRAPTTKSKKILKLEDLEQDDIPAAPLPPGFKPRSYGNKKHTTTTTERELIETTTHRHQNNEVTTNRPFRTKGDHIDFSKGFMKPESSFKNNSDSKKHSKSKQLEEEDSIKENSNKSIEDEVSKLLPPGYKSPKTTRRPFSRVTIQYDISQFLPPGFKLPTTNKEPSTTQVPLTKVEAVDDISKFLPPGFKSPPTDETEPTKETTEKSLLYSLLSKVQFKDVAGLLPPGYKETSPADESQTTIASSSGPGHLQGPGTPAIAIRKGPPTRATTEFTGWPSPSTTPLSIEKLLEQQKIAKIDISEFLPTSSSTSTTTTTTTTTTTSTTTPKPTVPGICDTECKLAGTIKIIDGVNWSPELLDHNTNEWKQLANDIGAQLNEVYSNAKGLKTWYKKVEIDSFSKGSVLVDYFVELNNIPNDISTMEVKRLFHDKLSPVMFEEKLQGDRREKELNLDEDELTDRSARQMKESFQLGKFIVDPIATDFIVIPKPVIHVEEAKNDLLLPQWAIAVIVIGVGSLIFVILFGVSVLVNRQKRAKKKGPVALTSDMLNELKKNHMGGIDIYGRDDTWDDDYGYSSKRYPYPSTSNNQDSWGSRRGKDYYYYDGPHFTKSTNQYPYDPDPFESPYHMQSNVMHINNMNTYNPRRIPRDFDDDF